MVKVTTPPSGPISSPGTSPLDAGKANPAAPNTTPSSKSTGAFSQAAGALLSYKSSSSPLVSRAVKIFSDGVMFPQNLLDVKDARNDPKYLRLLAAVLGLDELEHYFFSLEGEKQEEYLAHKAKQREEKWAKIEREKEEKRRNKQKAEGPEEEESDESEDE